MANANDRRRRNAPVMTDSMAYDLARQAQTAERYSTAPAIQPEPRRRQQAAPREKAAPM